MEQNRSAAHLPAVSAAAKAGQRWLSCFSLSAAPARSSSRSQTKRAGPKQSATPSGTTIIPQTAKSVSVIKAHKIAGGRLNVKKFAALRAGQLGSSATWMLDYCPAQPQFHNMKLLKDYSTAELRQIISVKEQIEKLQNELEALGNAAGNGAVEAPLTRGPRRMSAAARRKIALAQKARWARIKAAKRK